jgi:hypothetical protein
MDTNLPTEAPTPNVPDLLQRYLNGESIQGLADDTQHCFRTIYKWLLREAGPEYESIQTDALIARIADADYALGNARDKVSVARAREVARFARMDFERRRPKLYGPKQELDVTTKYEIIIEEQTRPVTQPVVDESRIISVNSEVLDKTENS